MASTADTPIGHSFGYDLRSKGSSRHAGGKGSFANDLGKLGLVHVQVASFLHGSLITCFAESTGRHWHWHHARIRKQRGVILDLRLVPAKSGRGGIRKERQKQDDG